MKPRVYSICVVCNAGAVHVEIPLLLNITLFFNASHMTIFSPGCSLAVSFPKSTGHCVQHCRKIPH